MKADRNIAALMAIIALAVTVGLISPAAADGVALGDGEMNVIDESNTDSTGPSITIANTMRVAQTQHFDVLPDETYPYDLYLWTQTLNIQGVLDGDVFVGCQFLDVSGEVTEDMAFFANTATFSGDVGDDIRGFAETIRIGGTVDGEVLVACANLYIEPTAVINGSLLAGAGTVHMSGHVKGSARLGAGTVTMNGQIDGNAEIFTDGGVTITGPGYVGGDLIYQGPVQLDLDENVVAGEVRYRPPEVKEDFDFDFSPMFGFALHIFEFFAAIIAGVIIIALTKDHARRTANIIRTRPLKSLGIGFVAYICAPIVILLTLVLIITIPFSLVLGLAYLIAVYIAKFYVAIWLGNLILNRGDRIMTTSPIPSMLLGLVPIYLLTAIPVLGTLIGIVIIFFGLGALLQRKETRLDMAFEPTEPADENALPSVFPGTTEG